MLITMEPELFLILKRTTRLLLTLQTMWMKTFLTMVYKMYEMVITYRLFPEQLQEWRLLHMMGVIVTATLSRTLKMRKYKTMKYKRNRNLARIPLLEPNFGNSLSPNAISSIS